MLCGRTPAGATEGSKPAFHESWSLSMPTIIMRPAHPAFRLQSDWEARPTVPWRVLRRWAARRRQRAALADVANDPHLLNDIGVTRQQALDEAAKPFWR